MTFTPDGAACDISQMVLPVIFLSFFFRQDACDISQLFFLRQDIEGAMSVTEVHGALGLDKLKNRTFQIFKVIQINLYAPKVSEFIDNYK